MKARLLRRAWRLVSACEGNACSLSGGENIALALLRVRRSAAADDARLRLGDLAYSFGKLAKALATTGAVIVGMMADRPEEFRGYPKSITSELFERSREALELAEWYAHEAREARR